MSYPRKGELPIIYLFAAVSVWFYLHEEPEKGTAAAVLLIAFSAGRPYAVGAIVAMAISLFPSFYGQAGLSVGAWAFGLMLSCKRLSRGAL